MIQMSVICHGSYFFIFNWKYHSMFVHKVYSEQMDASVLGIQCYRTRVNMDWGKFIEDAQCCRAHIWNDLLVTNNRCGTQNKKMEAVCYYFVLSCVLDFVARTKSCGEARPEPKLENFKYLKPEDLSRSHKRWILRKCLGYLKRTSYFQLGF